MALICLLAHNFVLNQHLPLELACGTSRGINPLLAVGSPYRCLSGGEGWPVFADTCRVAPRERESRARLILNTFRMLSPSREVQIFRGARLEEKETTKGGHGPRPDLLLWNHPDVSADRTAAATGPLTVGELHCAAFPPGSCMCGWMRVLNLTGARRVKFCRFLVDALNRLSWLGGDWTDLHLWGLSPTRHYCQWGKVYKCVYIFIHRTI